MRKLKRFLRFIACVELLSFKKMSKQKVHSDENSPNAS